MKDFITIVKIFVLMGVLLFIGAVFIDKEDLNILKNIGVRQDQVIVDSDPLSSMNRAKEITKGYCSTELWNDWSNIENEVDSDTAGLALYDVDPGFPPHQEMKLYIKPVLDSDYIPFVAWHECAHAKIRSLNIEQLNELTPLIKQEVQCDYEIQECLADVMAVYMIGTNYYNYYHTTTTVEQLDIAETIWNSTSEIQPVQDYSYRALFKINKLV